MAAPRKSVTELVTLYRNGDKEAIGEMVTVLYEELRSIARRQLRGGETKTGTLTPTGLVHELFESFQRKENLQVNDREHFLALASRTMRWMLLDRAKARQAGRRGGDGNVVPLDTGRVAADTPAVEDLAALEFAMRKLREQEERLAQVAELKLLAGMENAEIAEALGMSAATVKRDWALARAWLVRELEERDAA